jgi:hypothetical protein
LRDRKAIFAWLRGGAGYMKDRRSSRGGATNESRDLLEEALEESVDVDSEEQDDTEVGRRSRLDK